MDSRWPIKKKIVVYWRRAVHMAMASLLAPYDSYSITVTREGDTDRDVQPGFFKGMITLSTG